MLGKCTRQSCQRLQHYSCSVNRIHVFNVISAETGSSSSSSFSEGGLKMGAEHAILGGEGAYLQILQAFHLSQIWDWLFFNLEKESLFEFFFLNYISFY